MKTHKTFIKEIKYGNTVIENKEAVFREALYEVNPGSGGMYISFENGSSQIIWDLMMEDFSSAEELETFINKIIEQIKKGDLSLKIPQK